MNRLSALLIFFFASSISALPSLIKLTNYAPTSAQCPDSGLARDAIGLSTEETEYRQNRSRVASQALTEWITAVNKRLPSNQTFNTTNVEFPIVGLASSGGGVGSMLNNAGLVQALDNRDSTPELSTLKGLYQGMTYHTGASTGSWLLVGLIGNEGASVSSLVADKWSTSFASDTFVPAEPRRRPTTYSNIMLDTVAKSVAGYTPTLVDTWGRLISLHVLKGDASETCMTLSSLINRTDFQSHNLPYPVMTALHVDPRRNLSGCNSADTSSAQYELHPFEFGTWDSGIRSFSKTQFMGSQSTAGWAPSSSTCIQGFDSLGYLAAASSNPFNYLCASIPRPNRFQGQLGEVYNDLIDMTSMVHGLSFFDEYAAIPGPFAATTHVDGLYLVDGTQAGEEVPIWPLLPVERAVGVILAADFSTSTKDQLPDGLSLHQTYLRAKRMGFSRMPEIPPPAEFVKQGLNKQPTLFGCNQDDSKALIVYIPNIPHMLGTNVPAWKLQFDSTMVSRMVENGNLVATMKGDAQWPVCMACVILSKSEGQVVLPSACDACWDRFCWRG